jgi:hypothetical protein
MDNKDIFETNIGNDTNLVIDSFLINALKNPKSQKKFPPMNGYQRMIVHKIAHYYNLSHSYLNDKNAVTVVKNEKSEIPLLRLQDLIEEPEEEVRPSVRLLKKPKILNNPNNNTVETKINGEDNSTKGNTDNITKGNTDNITKGNTDNIEPEPEPKVNLKYSPPENVKILKKTEKKEEEKPKPNIQPLKTISDIKVPDEKEIEVKLEEREKEYEIARARIFNDNKVEEFVETENLENKPIELKSDENEYDDDVYLLNTSYNSAPSGNFVPKFDFNYQFMHESSIP